MLKPVSAFALTPIETFLHSRSELKKKIVIRVVGALMAGSTLHHIDPPQVIPLNVGVRPEGGLEIAAGQPIC